MPQSCLVRFFWWTASPTLCRLICILWGLCSELLLKGETVGEPPTPHEVCFVAEIMALRLVNLEQATASLGARYRMNTKKKILNFD